MPSVFFLFPSPRTLAQMFKQSQDWHNSWIPNSKQPSNTEGKNVKLWVRGFAKQWSSKRRGTMQTSIRFHSPKRFDYVSLTGSFLCLFHTVRIFPSNCHLKKKKKLMEQERKRERSHSLLFLQRQPKFYHFGKWLKIKTPLQSAFCD